MSSVLKNRRSISELEFFQNAIALRTELTKFILNDKNVPKSYRLYFALPMKSKLTALMDNITAAERINTAPLAVLESLFCAITDKKGRKAV